MMKKLIILLPLVALIVAGCSSTPEIRTVEKVVIQKEMEKKLPLSIPAPNALDLQSVEWVIITEDNIAEVWEEIKNDNEGVALFALRHGDYERLALNIADIKTQLGEYVIILKKYKEYYESE